MTLSDPIIRRAMAQDSDTIADISRNSRLHFLPYLPDLHSAEEDRAFFRAYVMPTSEVWVVDLYGRAVGFCAVQENWLNHLYLLPNHVGQGLGTALLRNAKAGRAHLQLWVFQRNTDAIAFYQKNGFRKVKETDGSGNEEKTPDALFEWRASHRPSTSPQ